MLNFDGSTSENLGNVMGESFKIVILCICSFFSGPVGYCSIKKAELLALREGLWEASRLTSRHPIVGGDSRCVIQWTSGRHSPP